MTSDALMLCPATRWTPFNWLNLGSRPAAFAFRSAYSHACCLLVPAGYFDSDRAARDRLESGIASQPTIPRDRRDTIRNIEVWRTGVGDWCDGSASSQ